MQPVIEVTYDALDLNQILNRITSKTTGAACIFIGMVRGQTRRGSPHETAYLEYEAYIPMAQGKMEQIAGEIIARWPEVENIYMVQRIGKLEAGAPSVVVACAASHRDAGIFEAARYGIDRLKEIVPIWKKEVSPEGEDWVEGDYLPRRED